MTRERDIIYENGAYWVLNTNHRATLQRTYMVMKDETTFSISDSAYAHTPDGLSLAIARCDYLAGRAKLAAGTRPA